MNHNPLVNKILTLGIIADKMSRNKELIIQPGQEIFPFNEIKPQKLNSADLLRNRFSTVLTRPFQFLGINGRSFISGSPIEMLFDEITNKRAFTPFGEVSFGIKNFQGSVNLTSYPVGFETQFSVRSVEQAEELNKNIQEVIIGDKIYYFGFLLPRELDIDLRENGGKRLLDGFGFDLNGKKGTILLPYNTEQPHETFDKLSQIRFRFIGLNEAPSAVQEAIGKGFPRIPD